MEDDTGPTYTVAICNYEMADTLAESLESIVSQLDDRFEVVVVDDGSEDGSLEILSEFAARYENFRFYEEDNDNLAEARNSSFRHADGTYVLESLDVDDRYEPIIQDFTNLFHRFESVREGSFYLWGRGINMAHRELLLEVPYRSLGYGEDKDFWRRLLARDRIVFLDHELPCESIGYDRNSQTLMSMWLDLAKVDFQTGITLRSLLAFSRCELVRADFKDRRESAFNLVSWPLSYWQARTDVQYDPVPGYRSYGRMEREIDRRKRTADGHAAAMGFDLDRDRFSDAGRRIFLSDC